MVFLDNYHVCKVCGESYSRACKLQSHMNVHSEENHVKGASLSQVPDCSDLYSHGNKKSLDSSVRYDGKDHIAKNTVDFHKTEETKETPSESTQNSEVLRKIPVSRSVKDERSIVMEDEKGKIYHECEVCQQKFTKSSTLKSHMRKHTGERPYKCKTCDQSFTYYQCLWNHERRHTGEKQFECKVCLKRFVYYQSLWNHKKIHGEKAYECKVCGKKFTHMYSLKIHSRLHTNEMPYECTLCKKRFLTRVSLKRHCKTHSKETPLECKEFKKAGRSFTSISKHEKQHTQQNSKYLKNGMKSVNSFPKVKRESLGVKNEEHCNSICQGGLSDTESHTRPTEMHKKEKSFSCFICGKILASLVGLKIHIRTHTGEKPYKCSLCSKAYIDNSGLWKHIKVHEARKVCQGKVCENDFVHSHSLKRHAKYSSSEDLNQLKKSSKVLRSSNTEKHNIPLTDTKSSEYKTCDKIFEECNGNLELEECLIRHCKLGPTNGYETSASREIVCNHCKSVFFSVDDVTDHQKRMMCKKCNDLFYCSHMFYRHTSTCSCQNVIIREAESTKTVFRATHSKNELDECEKDLLESFVMYPCHNPDLSEKHILHDNHVETHSYDRQNSSGSHVYHPIPNVSFCNYDYLTHENLYEWAKNHNQESRYFVGSLYTTTNSMRVSPILCDICGESFVNEAAYTYHRMQHFVVLEGNRCLTCGEISANETDFIAHAITHLSVL